MTAAKSPSMLMTLGVAPAPSSTVKVAYTFTGDANLDGFINGDDFFQLDAHVGQGGAGIGYFEGDLDYSGLVDADDYFLINANYNKAPAPAAPAAGAAFAPVPVIKPLTFSSRELLDELR